MMTDEELRRLDAQIAERVIGWRVFGYDDPAQYGAPVPFLTAAPDGNLCLWPDMIAWRPTEQNDQAWQAVEKVKQRFPVFTLDSKFDTWSAGFGCEQCGVLDGDWHVADTAPLAICLAALAAMDERR